jgi:NAD(P)H-dependent FMN reductase
MRAAGGAMGTSRAEHRLGRCFVFLNGSVMNRPEAMTPQARDKFAANGKLTDKTTGNFITVHLAALGAGCWACARRPVSG